jgi:hypothetical protein
MRIASSLNLVRRETVFDPDAVAVLTAALGETWDRLRKSGSECVRPAYARVMREVVARCIIDMAQGGIRDEKELADGAVRFLKANYRHDSKEPCWETLAGSEVTPPALPEKALAAGAGSPPPARAWP